MKRWISGLLAILLAGIVLASAWYFTAPEARANPPGGKAIRIGVYDPRAVAVAYAHSQFFRQRLAAKRKEWEKAKAANDQAKIKELDAWGADQQIRLHLQGFAAAPVDDLLADVKDQLPRIAETANVQDISLHPDYASPGVEVVDITDDLVKLWAPDAKTLKMIAGLRKSPPIPIEQIAKMGPND
jgi:hypothetical protein